MGLSEQNCRDEKTELSPGGGSGEQKHGQRDQKRRLGTVGCARGAPLRTRRHRPEAPAAEWGESAAHLPVQLHSQDGVGVAVVADLGPLLKVANLQLPGGFEANDGHQAA